MAALHTPVAQLEALAALSAQAAPRTSQFGILAAIASPASQRARVSLVDVMAAVAPQASAGARTSQEQVLIAYAAGETNVAARASQGMALIAYGTSEQSAPRTDAWTYVLDGHRMWVLPLGLEGDWQYDTVTKQWSQLQTQGFAGLNFTFGVMWGLRIMGGDTQYPFLYELDPNESDDEGWRPVQHIVTGGVQTRSPNAIGVANFRLAASVGFQSDSPIDVDLTFSDDNGATWVGPFTITISEGVDNTQLVWPALGSFNAPGRIFQVADQGGFLSISGADVALNNYDEDDNQAAGGGGNGG